MKNEIKELISEILKKSYEINKKTRHTVFINYWGHVSWFEIIIYRGGWKENENLGEHKTIKLCSNVTVVKELEEMLKILRNLEGGEKDCQKD